MECTFGRIWNFLCLTHLDKQRKRKDPSEIGPPDQNLLLRSLASQKVSTACLTEYIGDRLIQIIIRYGR